MFIKNAAVNTHVKVKCLSLKSIMAACENTMKIYHEQK